MHGDSAALAADQEFFSALLARRIEVLERLLADDFTLVALDGVLSGPRGRAATRNTLERRARAQENEREGGQNQADAAQDGTSIVWRVPRGGRRRSRRRTAAGAAVPRRGPRERTGQRGIRPAPPTGLNPGAASGRIGLSTLDRRGSMGSRLLTGGILAVIGLITVKLLIGVFGFIAAVFGFLFFKVLPIVLIGWIVMRIVRTFRDRPEQV